MSARAKIPPDVETKVLVECRRRCCLCVYLNQDWAEKSIQVAHIDRDPSNSVRGNLAALCLEHHDAYDTRRSQSKGYTPGELRTYQNRLLEAIRKWNDVPPDLIATPPLRNGTDESVDRDSNFLTNQVVLNDEPLSLVRIKPTERPGNDLLRLAREGWLDASIDSVSEVNIRVIGEAPQERDRQLLIVGNAEGGRWQIGLFEREGHSWPCVLNMLLEGPIEERAIRVIPGDVHVAVVLDRQLMRGTGILNRSTFFYTTSRAGPRLALQYPQTAWVSGWCGFDRAIRTETLKAPATLQHGAKLQLQFHVEYSGGLLTGIEVPLFELHQLVTLEWDDDAGIFIPLETSHEALASAAQWFDDGDVQFLERHYDAIASIAATGTGEQREWLRRFLLRCSESPAATRLRPLLRHSDERNTW